MTSPNNKFFTWIEEPFTEPAKVPARIKHEMRVLWLNGAKIAELARTFKMPMFV